MSTQMFPFAEPLSLGPGTSQQVSPQLQPRLITLEQLKQEIRNYGITKLARDLGCSRQHLQNVCCGLRKPGKALLSALQYELEPHYRDIMTSPQTTNGKNP